MDYLNSLEEPPKLARKRIRFIAAFLDYTIFMIFFYSIGYNFGDRYYVENGFGFTLNNTLALIVFIFWIIIFPVIEGLTGQTIGKMVFKIKVTRYDYTNVRLGHSLIRHLFDFIDFFPFFGITGLLFASNTKLKQRVGDLVAKTIVILK
jgi:uncharacterized RDD family membrane protein YckC